MDDLRQDMERQDRPAREDLIDEAPGAGFTGVEVTESGPAENTSPPHAWSTAALAHVSIVLTLILGLAGGVGSFVGLVVPLAIYLSYRERERFVAFHALQALIYQGLGVVIYLGLVIILALAVTVAWTVSGLLSVVAIGLLLMPLAMLLTLLMVVVLLVLPLIWTAYGLYAAYEVYQGHDFHYWLLGEWLEREGMA